MESRLRADLVATPELALTGEGASRRGRVSRAARSAASRRCTSRSATRSSSSGSRSCWRSSSPRSSARGSPTPTPFEFGYPLGEPPSTRALARHDGSPGQDVYAQFVYGLRSSFIVGALAATGRRACSGWRSGSSAATSAASIDEILSMLTNIVLVIPTLAVLIIVAAYLSVGSLVVGGAPDRAHLVAVGGARDPRADVLARLARLRQPRAAVRAGDGAGDRQRDRAEHELLPLPHVHPALRRRRAHRRDARLPRPRPVAGDVARADDEQRRLERRAAARHVVVVHPAGRRRSRRSSAAST